MELNLNHYFSKERILDDLKLLTVTSPVKLVTGRVATPAIVKLSAANVPSTSTPLKMKIPYLSRIKQILRV